MESHIKIQEYTTPFGELILGSFEHKLCLCDWKYRRMRKKIDQRIKDHLKADFKEEESEIIKASIDQLDQYFRRKRIEFDIPLLLTGTHFQKSVWYKLLQIPYGTTVTYASLSDKLQNAKAIRAVASANGANAISIIVPCHRVIGSNGKMIGYAGGVRTKMKLLEIEKVVFNNQYRLF